MLLKISSTKQTGTPRNKCGMVFIFAAEQHLCVLKCCHMSLEWCVVEYWILGASFWSICMHFAVCMGAITFKVTETSGGTSVCTWVHFILNKSLYSSAAICPCRPIKRATCSPFLVHKYQLCYSKTLCDFSFAWSSSSLLSWMAT